MGASPWKQAESILADFEAQARHDGRDPEQAGPLRVDWSVLQRDIQLSEHAGRQLARDSLNEEIGAAGRDLPE